MQHSEIRAKSESVPLFVKTDSANNDCLIFKLAENSTFTQISYTADIINIYANVFKTILDLPNEDCLLCILFKAEPIFIRVGEPTIKLLYYANQTGLTLPYVQYLSNGALADEGELVELGQGFYSYKPTDLSLSIVEIDNHPFIVKVPYIITTVIQSGDGHFSSSYFADTGYNFFGFLGETNSYFDAGQSKWINDTARIASASDLGKAITDRYSLVWSDNLDPDWIGNYIKYIRTYNEETKRFMVYTPSITPEDNVNNFALTTIDELDNHVIRGVQILLIQDLETVPEGSSGTIIDFRET